MALNKAFLRHSMFAEYGVEDLFKRHKMYRSTTPPADDDAWAARVVRFLKDLEVHTLWIQLFSRGNVIFDDTGPWRIRCDKLIAQLAHEQIEWVPWGYCAGNQCTRNQLWIADLRNRLGLTTFIIDAEPGNPVIENPDPDGDNLPDDWDATEFKNFVTYVNGLFGTDNLAITTWPLLAAWEHHHQARTLMKSVAGLVGMFNPQTYASVAPVTQIQKAIKAWHDDGFTNPLVTTARAYWDKDVSQTLAEAAVAAVVGNFGDWNKLVGFGWYHAGKAASDQGAMTDAMIATIKGGHLSGKPYKTV